MRAAATEIRFAGNEAAHGDVAAVVTEERPGIEDAAEIVGLMDSILERLYQEPTRIAKIRTKRELRQEQARLKALATLQPGDRVKHDTYGLGTVMSAQGTGDDDGDAKIDFGGEYGIKHLVLRYAPIQKL
jgi:transcription-repair coupling factor (superfamily II helicase)